MASTLVRVTDFVPSTPILSGEVDSEFNQVVNLLNGTSSAVKGVIKVSDAGDPPLELNQLSTGPIQEWYQAGILKAALTNSGGFSGSGDITVTKANPLLILEDTALSERAALASSANLLMLTRDGQFAPPDVGIDLDTGVATFAAIPVLPASDPATANQAARKGYVDGKRTLWSAGFTISDVAARGVDSGFANIQGVWIPSGGFTCTHIGAKFGAGTASGSFTLTFRKQPFGSQSQTDLGTITFNPGTLGAGVEVDIADHTFTALDWIYVAVTAVSSPLQLSVWCSFRGFQTVS
jgi:hypothetical protein